MPRAAVTLCGRLRCGAVYHSNWFNYVGVGRGIAAARLRYYGHIRETAISPGNLQVSLLLKG